MKALRLVGILAAIGVIVAAAFLLRAPSVREKRNAGANDANAASGNGGLAANAPGRSGSSSGGANGSSANGAKTQTTRTAGPAPSAEPLTFVGALVPGAQAALSTAMPARIAAVTVQAGDRVRRGKLLVQLSLPEVQTQASTAQAGVAAAEAQVRKAVLGRRAQLVKSDSDIAAARAGLQQAQGKLQQAVLGRDAARAQSATERTAAQAGVRKAQAALNQAKETLRGLERLAGVGGVSQADLEGARTQVTVSQADLESAQAQVRSLQAGSNGMPYRVAAAQSDVEAAQTGVTQAQAGLEAALKAKRQTAALGDQDIRAAEAALAQARAGAGGAEAAAAQTRLVSPLDGVVVAVNAHAGETAQPGVSLVTVNSQTGLRAEALVPARQLVRLRIGQPARVSVDTRPGESFAATVAAIAPTAEPNGRTFRVRFNLLKPDGLRPVQTALITIRKQ